MIASGSFHRFHDTRHTTKAATSQPAAITLDVIQSHVTTGDSLFAEQPHGLDAITTTDSRTAARAAAPKTKAMTLVVRIYEFAGTSGTNGLSLFVAEDVTAWFHSAKKASHAFRDTFATVAAKLR